MERKSGRTGWPPDVWATELKKNFNNTTGTAENIAHMQTSQNQSSNSKSLRANAYDPGFNSGAKQQSSHSNKPSAGLANANSYYLANANT